MLYRTRIGVSVVAHARSYQGSGKNKRSTPWWNDAISAEEGGNKDGSEGKITGAKRQDKRQGRQGRQGQQGRGGTTDGRRNVHFVVNAGNAAIMVKSKTLVSHEKSWDVPLEFGDWEEYEAALDLLILEGPYLPFVCYLLLTLCPCLHHFLIKHYIKRSMETINA
eukprot:9402054-Pyramimonas_sp.AAC.1